MTPAERLERIDKAYDAPTGYCQLCGNSCGVEDFAWLLSIARAAVAWREAVAYPWDEMKTAAAHNALIASIDAEQGA